MTFLARLRGKETPRDITAVKCNPKTILPPDVLSSLKPEDAAFANSYFGAPASLEMSEGKYLFPTKEYTQSLSGLLSSYLQENGRLSEGLFETFRKMARRYAESNPNFNDHMEKPENAALHAQLRRFIRNVDIVSDERSDPALREICKLPSPPVQFEMFTDYIDKGYVLADDIRPEFTITAERLAAQYPLWQGEFGRIFFASVAQAVGLISEKEPDITRKARILLLDMAGQHTNFSNTSHGSVLFHLVYSFRTERDTEALRSICSDGSHASIALKEVAGEILSGRYKDALWAI